MIAGTILLYTLAGGVAFFALRGTRNRSRRRKAFRFAPTLSPLPELEPAPEEGPLPDVDESWHPPLEYIAWSDRIFISPDFAEVLQGGVWALETEHPRVIEEAKSAAPDSAGNARMVLHELIKRDSPRAAEAGYSLWGPEFQQWYDGWEKRIESDLLLYAENLDFLL